MLGLNDFYLEDELNEHIDEHHDLQAAHEDHVDHTDFGLANTETLYAGTASVSALINQSVQGVGGKYIEVPGFDVVESQGYNVVNAQILTASQFNSAEVLATNENYLNIGGGNLVVKQGADGVC